MGPLSPKSDQHQIPPCDRAIFVWPWNENARTKQKQQKNGNRAIWLVYRTDTNARGFWLVKRTLGWKNFMPEELSRNCFDVILQHDWSIEQCFLHIRVFLAGKRRVHVFFFSTLADKTNNEHLPKPCFKDIRKSLYQCFVNRVAMTITDMIISLFSVWLKTTPLDHVVVISSNWVFLDLTILNPA